jgi:methylated-DNA-[protein]-cysteine S-methyltransferase
MKSPVGALRLVADEDALVAVCMEEHAHAPSFVATDGRHHPVLLAAREQLAEWFAGERTRFELPLRPAGTPFQRAVWRLLAEIPFGQTMSYGELARRLGRPGSARAVGAANGRNPLPVIVPCHRVIGGDGGLTGYGGGLDRKEWLLRLEGALL